MPDQGTGAEDVGPDDIEDLIHRPEAADGKNVIDEGLSPHRQRGGDSSRRAPNNGRDNAMVVLQFQRCPELGSIGSDDDRQRHQQTD